MKAYKIKEGSYSSGFRFKPYCGDTTMKVTFQFNETAEYNLGNSNQFDWNKLFGFSRGHHHNNSIRLVWRWNVEKRVVEVSKYSYINGTRVISEALLEASIGQEYTLVLQIHKCKTQWGYLLFPYFGGDEVSPHDINIKLKYSFIT